MGFYRISRVQPLAGQGMHYFKTAWFVDDHSGI